MALLGAGLGWVPAAGAARAAGPAAPALVTFAVNSANDGTADFTNDAAHDICRTNVNNNTCTLRAAVMNANRLAGGAIINLPAGSYFLTIPIADPDDEATGNLNISTTVTLVGAGAGSSIIDGGQFDNIFVIAANAALTITGVTLQNGNASFPVSELGGAIVNHGRLSLANSVLIGNQASGAGGLLNSGSAALDNVTVEANLATDSTSGGIENLGVMTITNSTVDGNRAPGVGGGLSNGGSAASLTVFNSTISNNSTQNLGGGVFNNAPARFLATTIAGNLADSDATGGAGAHGGGIYNFAPANQLLLANTLLANNYISVTLNDCSGGVTSQDYNEFATTNDCSVAGVTTHNIINPASKLGPLADNGGPTKTRGLLPLSPALDQIPPAQCHDLFGTAPAPDQRGVARPAGSKCDIGAFEGELPQPPYFRNLVQNGDAEASAGSPTGAPVGQPGWNYGGQFTVVDYGAAGGFPGVLSPTVPANHGANFFAGGNTHLSTAQQTLFLPPIGSSIDASGVHYVLSGDLGGFGNQDDNARVIVTFLDGNVSLLGAPITLGPVLAANRGDITGFFHTISIFGLLPPQARFVNVEIDLTRVSNVGPYNDGYADNISFVLLPKAVLYLPLQRQ